MQRRAFLTNSIGLLAATALADPTRLLASELPVRALPPEHDNDQPFFSSADSHWQAAYDKACAILTGNVQILPRYSKPVLIEGAQYPGIWQECAPQEGLVYRHFHPDAARNNQMTFFALQRSDGQLPADNKRSEAGFGQIQMVVPIAATAWELALSTGDDELLQAAYNACSRWDAWLMRYRNTRGTGLIEGFCTYDTGMDNSSRWAGMPRQCPNKDAKQCPPVLSLPRLCPDLSATVYGARVALARMAEALGKQNEAADWTHRAETIRKLIIDRLYAPEDAAFYDLGAQNHFVKIRTDVLTRVCGEHVVDRVIFDEMWRRQIGNPQAFWAPFPIPSCALNDHAFIRPIPHNNWGGASQALTALRAPRWMDHYERSVELGHLMQQWCEALQRDMTFRQQLDPLTGAFTEGDKPGYSPSSLVMVDFTWRLAGISEEPDNLQWNIRPGIGPSKSAHFRLKLRKGTAEMRYDRDGSTLIFRGRRIAHIRGTARLLTDHSGKPLALVGLSPSAQTVELHRPGKRPQPISIKPNQRVAL